MPLLNSTRPLLGGGAGLSIQGKGMDMALALIERAGQARMAPGQRAYSRVWRTLPGSCVTALSGRAMQRGLPARVLYWWPTACGWCKCATGCRTADKGMP